jgi:two-component system, NtrC family, sensor kinase
MHGGWRPVTRAASGKPVNGLSRSRNGTASSADSVGHGARADRSGELHSQRLAALGTQTASLAHEINNVMTPVVGHAQHALKMGDAESMAKALRRTLKQSEMVLSMMRRVLGFASDDSASWGTVDVEQLIDDSVDCLFRDLSKDGIDIVRSSETGLVVSGHAGQLQQVLFNLLINARDAMDGKKGRITISSVLAGDLVEISVSDRGCGIDPDDLSKVFDAFYSTKMAGEGRARGGSGLGLMVCKEIVEGHQGSMSVQSEPGRGSTFTIRLPRCD